MAEPRKLVVPHVNLSEITLLYIISSKLTSDEKKVYLKPLEDDIRLDILTAYETSHLERPPLNTIFDKHVKNYLEVLLSLPSDYHSIPELIHRYVKEEKKGDMCRDDELIVSVLYSFIDWDSLDISEDRKLNIEKNLYRTLDPKKYEKKVWRLYNHVYHPEE